MMKTIKKCTSLFLSLILTLSALSVSANATDKEFYISDSVIVIEEDASVSDKYAAERLKYYLDSITGCDIEIVKGSSYSSHKISILNDTLDNVDGSYTITSSSDELIITGCGNKGTINGVYAFLEKFCGCYWYESEIIVIPENDILTVPQDINITYTPFFEYTETDTRSSRDPEYSIANGLTGGIYKNLTAEQGYAVEYIGGSSHTLVNQFCKPSEYYDSNPEYFALVDGERVPDQLCLTNENVKDIVTAEALELLENKHIPDASLQILSITQADNGNYCQCSECNQLDTDNNSQAGTMITFVNEIAERIKATGLYDNIVFDTFAYQYTRKAPTKVTPRSDVIVRLCSIECCFGHSLDDPDCKENTEFMSDLDAWSKICNRLYIWNYNLNCDESVNIYPNFGTMQRNTQIFYEYNVKGIYQQGVFYISECDAEFGELKTYMLSKLMQDPYLDFDAVMSGYLDAVYGPGGKYIKEFIEITTKRAVTKYQHLKLEQDARYSLPGITICEINRCNELWELAKSEAETEEQLKRILRSELCWRYWKCANICCEFSRLQHPYLWMKANKDLYNDFVKMGITRLGERVGHDLSDNDLRHLTRRIYTWITLYDEPIWDAINPYALIMYNMLEKMYLAFYPLYNFTF